MKLKQLSNLPYFWIYIKNLVNYSPGRFFSGCLLTIINTLCAGVGLLLLVPLLHYTGWLSDSAQDFGMATRFLKYLPSVSGKLPLSITLGIFIVVIMLASAIQYMDNMITNQFKQSYLYHLKQQFNHKIAYARWNYLLNQKLKTIEHLFFAGLSQISLLTHYCFQLVSSVIVIAFYLLFALIISPQLTSITLVLSLLLFSIIYRFNPMQNGKKNFAIHSKMHAEFSSFLDGVKLAKSYNTVATYLERFDILNQSSKTIQEDFVKSQRLISMLIKMFSAIMFAVLFYLALEVFHLSLLAMVALLVVFSRLLPKLTSLQQSYFQVMNTVPVYIQACEMVKALDQHRERYDICNNLRFDQGIQLNQVNFSYTKTPVLNDISCFIQTNHTTAIVGHSGSGKSTLADLLIGVLTPHSGEIKIDQTLLSEAHLYAWRSMVSYVPQETYLFNDTIRANLLWAEPNATDIAMYDAIELAILSDFVNELPDKLDTVIGDRGIHLSGGQRQRLALARALLRKPKVLILDEATSALDMQNEEQIYHTLKQLHGQMTIILITHRLATLKAVDNILVLEKGKLVEKGSFGELSNNTQSEFSKIFALNVFELPDKLNKESIEKAETCL